MLSEILEIVELQEGGYVLRKSDAEEAPMISIQFSDQALLEFDGQQAELARAMIVLGVKLMAEKRSKQLQDNLAPVLH